MLFRMRRWSQKFFPEKYELSMVVLFYIAFFLLTINYRLFADDAAHVETAKEIGIWKLYLVHLTQWQPRVVSYFLTNFFVVFSNLWKFIAPLPVVVVLYDFYHVVCKKSDIRLVMLTFSSVFLMSAAVFFICYLWISGWTNYMVLFALMWIALKPIIKLTRGISNGGLDTMVGKTSYFIVAVSACWSEQFAMLIVGFVICAMAFTRYRKIHVTKTMWIYSTTLLVVSLIFFYLNAKSPRANGMLEIGDFFQDFEMRSFIDKFFQMLNLTHNNLVFDSQFIMLPLLGMLAFTIYKKHNSFVRYFGFLPLSLQVFLTFPFNLLFNNQLHVSYPITTIFNLISTGYDIDSFDIALNTLFIPLCTTTEVILIGFTAFFVFDNVAEKFVNFVLWVGGLCCSYILMLSPTMYASGNRLFLLLDMILVFFFIGVNHQAFTVIKSETIKNIYTITLISLAIFVFCGLFFRSNVMHHILY